VLSITARKTLRPYTLQGHTVPAGVYVAACIYLAHRRPDAPYIPFGGGTRRCLGAAFATLEMREVIRAVNERFTLTPDRPEGERMRRRSVVLAPSRQGSIIPRTR
jgi:cytochrome P450